MTKFLEQIKQFCKPSMEITWLDMASDISVYDEYNTEACINFHCEIDGKFHNVIIWANVETECVEFDGFSLASDARIVSAEIAEVLDENDKNLPNIKVSDELLRQLLIYRLDNDDFYLQYNQYAEKALKESAKYDLDGVC